MCIRDRSLLNAGTRLLEIGGGGHLKALAVRMPPVATILPSEEVLTAERETAIHAEQENWAGQLHDVATGWNALAARHGVHVDWIDLEGDAPRIVVEHGRRADTILVSCPVDRHDYRMRECVHAALFETETPVLMVPRNFEGPLGHVIAIAWKDDERATKAVRAAIPLLRDAKRVHVLRANHPAEMPPILKEHDIAAELHNVPDGDTPAAERILAAAHQLDADVLVMGAFAHGEWREMIFGGVTRYMLASADLPLLMRH